MKYLSVCSGIEAASVAWHDFGWEPVAFSEIEPFPCSVLAERFPGVPNLGDMTKFKEWKIACSCDSGNGDRSRGESGAAGSRYKALGNSMAVPVMAWIGKRIDDEEKK